MNILLYETGSGFGGSAVSLYRLVKCINREKYAPHIVVHGLGPRIAEIQKMGINVQILNCISLFSDVAPVNSFYSTKFYTHFIANAFANSLRIARLIRKWKACLVHLNNGIYEGFSALLAARLSGIPCIAHIRGTEALTRLELKVGHWLKMIVTLNSYMENEYKKAFGAEKVCLIFNGVDLDAFQNVKVGNLRMEYGLDQEVFLVGTIARLVPGKGISEFLKAASEVVKVLHNAKFFVVGNDPFGASYESEQKHLCSDLGIEENVIFTGWRDDMPSVLSDLDVVAQVSTSPEGMSLTPIEAMALGKPVITTDVPGYTDTVVDGVTGFIVPKGDTNVLADRIIALAKDPNRAKSMGILARKRVQDQFDVRITARKIEEVYDQCIEDKSRVEK